MGDLRDGFWRVEPEVTDDETGRTIPPTTTSGPDSQWRSVKRILKVACCLLVGLLGACASSGQDTRYLDANEGAALALPPDITKAEIDTKFELPKAFSGDDKSVRNQIPVLASVESLKLEGSGDFYWLSVDESVDNLYAMVKDFWGSEGFVLEKDEPVIGMMQTEWLFQDQGAQKKATSWFSSLFQSADLTASQDQYITRLARDDNGGGSRIYIAHRGTEYIPRARLDDKNSDGGRDNQWHFRQPEPELEIEMLSRLMVYLGMQDAEVASQVAGVKLFKPRASYIEDDGDNSPAMIMNDGYQLAWHRIYHELQRLNYEIYASDYKGGLLSEGTITVNLSVIKKVKDKGFLSLFTSENENLEQIILVIAKDTYRTTKITLETFGGKIYTAAAGAKFLKLLYRHLK